MNHIELFKSLKTEDDYRKYCLENYKKFTFQINKMNLFELKNLVFSNQQPDTTFEGIATIISAVNEKDFNKLINYIYSVSLESPNILRVLFDTLDSINLYSGRFQYELIRFKNTNEKKLRSLLFDLGQLNYITKLDLIEMFRRLIYG